MRVSDVRLKQAAPWGSALLDLSGMEDDRAARSVRSALTLIRGVSGVEILVATRQARVDFDPEKVQPWQLQRAVQAVGCGAKLRS